MKSDYLYADSQEEMMGCSIDELLEKEAIENEGQTEIENILINERKND